MPLYNRSSILLEYSPTDQDVKGKSYAIASYRDQDLQLAAFVDIYQQGGAGAPATTVYLETSHNGDWLHVADPITLAADGELHRMVKLNDIGPLIRARVVVDGATRPSQQVEVKLVADGDFRLKEAAPKHDTSYNTTTTSSGPTAETNPDDAPTGSTTDSHG